MELITFTTMSGTNISNINTLSNFIQKAKELKKVSISIIDLPDGLKLLTSFLDFEKLTSKNIYLKFTSAYSTNIVCALKLHGHLYTSSTGKVFGFFLNDYKKAPLQCNESIINSLITNGNIYFVQ